MAGVTLYYKDDPILSRMKDGIQYGWYVFMVGSVSDELNEFERGTYGWESYGGVFEEAVLLAHHDLLFWE